MQLQPLVDPWHYRFARATIITDHYKLTLKKIILKKTNTIAFRFPNKKKTFITLSLKLTDSITKTKFFDENTLAEGVLNKIKNLCDDNIWIENSPVSIKLNCLLLIHIVLMYAINSAWFDYFNANRKSTGQL